MKKKYFSLILVLIAISTFAQDIAKDKTIKYRRSSLHTMLIESGNFPNKEIVMKAYNDAGFPANYNDHSIDIKSFDPAQFPITDEDRNAAGVEKSELGSIVSGALADATAGIVDKDAKDMPVIIKKYIETNKIGNKLVAKWYGRNPTTGAFNMGLIQDRGQYDASQMQVSIAKGSEIGTAALGDAGEDLIQNTFVVFSRMNFVPNEIVAAAIRDAAKATAENAVSGFALTLANKGIDAIYNKTKEGYSVWTTSYLYKLNWNDSVQATFYNDMYFDSTNIDQKKKDLFDNSEIFNLEYVGTEKSSSLVTFSLKKADKERTEEQIIQKSTVRNVDAVFAKLQKKYEIFKPKVPLYTGDPITAKIGMKEGLEGGEKFEVLEQVQDTKTGKVTYKKVGTITAEKGKIWDNRFNLADEQQPADGEKAIDKTTFSGGSGYYPGMLIRQIKK